MQFKGPKSTLGARFAHFSNPSDHLPELVIMFVACTGAARADRLRRLV